VVDLTGGAAARGLAEELRRAGVGAERSFDNRSLRAQLRQADKSGARLALIVGREELDSGSVRLKDLRGEQAEEQVSRAEVVGIVQTMVGEGDR